jgi:uncharacterized protein YdeI (YjbR/CyaY-like superfamily)
MKPVFFKSSLEFRKWLEKNHDRATEIFVGYYKMGTGKNSMTWSESVDQALCFGWIDGVRRSIDEKRYMNRFTPRKTTSNWSAINIKKVEELTKTGLMHEAGLAAFSKRKENKSVIYSYENALKQLRPDFENKFRSDKKAWTYFESLAPSYRKISIHWVMSAKQEATQVSRLKKLIAESRAGRNTWKDNKYDKSKKK